jgi:hypothetical protein
MLSIDLAGRVRNAGWCRVEAGPTVADALDHAAVIECLQDVYSASLEP